MDKPIQGAPAPRPKKDIAGQRFGRLVAISYAGVGKWFCRCDCGSEKIVSRNHLMRGGVSSCGCLLREIAGKAAIKHGMSGTPTYRCWTNMKSRCTNPSIRSYKDYGARGITVCDRWNSFENFLADMGEKPTGMSIERSDSNGNYEPGNCHWATVVEQNSNTRRNNLISLNGETKTLSEWCRIYQLKPQCVGRRLKRGMTPEDAFELRKCLHGVASSAPCAQCEAEIEATT